MIDKDTPWWAVLAFVVILCLDLPRMWLRDARQWNRCRKCEVCQNLKQGITIRSPHSCGLGKEI